MISSSFFGVLILGQTFWKDAEIVDRRFSVMSPRKKIAFRFESRRFSASTIFLISFTLLLYY